MQRHWQSLNSAIHDGEAVWFRYADHRILLPMLTAMTPGERDALLGPCEQLMIEGQCVTQSQDFIWVPAVKRRGSIFGSTSWPACMTSPVMPTYCAAISGNEWRR